MYDSWRRQPLTKGDLYDILNEVAAEVQEKGNEIVKNLGRGNPVKPLVKISLGLVTDACKTMANKLKER